MMAPGWLFPTSEIKYAQGRAAWGSRIWLIVLEYYVEDRFSYSYYLAHRIIFNIVKIQNFL